MSTFYKGNNPQQVLREKIENKVCEAQKILSQDIDGDEELATILNRIFLYTNYYNKKKHMNKWICRTNCYLYLAVDINNPNAELQYIHKFEGCYHLSKYILEEIVISFKKDESLMESIKQSLSGKYYVYCVKIHVYNSYYESILENTFNSEKEQENEFYYRFSSGKAVECRKLDEYIKFADNNNTEYVYHIVMRKPEWGSNIANRYYKCSNDSKISYAPYSGDKYKSYKDAYRIVINNMDKMIKGSIVTIRCINIQTIKKVKNGVWK